MRHPTSIYYPAEKKFQSVSVVSTDDVFLSSLPPALESLRLLRYNSFMSIIEKFFSDTEKVRLQLLEGAITYPEWFNKTVTMALELMETDEYKAYVASPDTKPT